MATKKYKAKSWLSKFNDKETKQRFKDELTRTESRQARVSNDADIKTGIAQLGEKAMQGPETKHAAFFDQTLDERLDTFWDQDEYDKDLESRFQVNIKHPLYKEVISKYGMPDFTKTIKMTDTQKPLNLTEKIKSYDGKSMEEQLNPLFVKLGIVDVKKKVYKFKETSKKGFDDFAEKVTGGETIITTPREYEVIGENKDNYYYMDKNGALVSLAKTEVTERKPSAKHLEQLWKEQINSMIDTARGTTADEEIALQEEIKVYGTEKLEEDLAVLERNGKTGYEDSPPSVIRKMADIERQKEKPWLQRIGEAEGLGVTLDEITSPFGGQMAERLGENIPNVASGMGLPENQQDIATDGESRGGANFLSDLLGYGIGLGAPTGGGMSIGGTAFSVGQKATAKIGPKIGGRLGAAARFFKTPAAQKLLESPIASRLGREAMEGATSAPLITGYEAAAQDLSAKETLKKGVIEAGIGAGAGVILGEATRGIGKVLEKKAAKKTTSRTAEKVKEIAEKKAEDLKKNAEKSKRTKESENVTKYSKETYAKKYKLDEDLSGKSVEERKTIENERVDKVLNDVGKNVKGKVGTSEPKKILKYYKEKYKGKLDNVKLKGTLKSESRYGATEFKESGEIIIKYNPKKPENIRAGSIRHEIEHVLDQKSGFKGVERKVNKAARTTYEKYASKTHHKYYDFFEPNYVRKQDVKAAITAGEKVPDSVLKELGLEGWKPPKNPPIKVVGESGDGVSRFRGKTVPEGEGTTEPFRKHLDSKDPATYEIASNKEDWAQAVDKVNKSPEDTWATVSKVTEKTVNSRDIADMMALVKHHELNKNFEAATEVLDHLSKVGTKSGQAIQILSLWNRMTPEGMLKYAKSKTARGIESKFPKRSEQLKSEIKNLQDTIKKMENEGKKGTRGYELNMKRLEETQAKLEKLETKISKMDLQPEDAAYLSERMNNFKSEAFREKYYNEKLDQLTKGRTPTEKQKFKASEYASRRQNIELRRALVKIEELTPTGPREKIRAIQRINLLTNARTAVRNNVSNTLFGLVELTRENTFGAAIDYVAAAARTKSLIAPITNPLESGRTTVFSPIRKTAAYFKGFGKGTKALADDLYDSIKVYGEYINTSETKGMFEAQRGRAFKGDNIVGSTLNKLDNVVKTIVTDRPFYEAAKAARISELMKIAKVKKPTQEMLDNASLYGLDKVFQNDSWIASTMTQIRKKIPGMEIILPFTQTPGNVLDKLIDYTPLALTKIVKQFGQKGSKGFGTKLFVDRASRILSGGGLAALGWVMAKNNLITGNLYAEPSKKKREYGIVKGKKSYAFKMGGKFYTYDWLTPVGGVLSSIADIYAIQGEEQSLKTLEILLGSPINTVANQSFMSGLFALFSEQSISEGLLKGVGGSVGQAVPFSTLTRQVATYTDTFDRDVQSDSTLGYVKKRTMKGLPGFRQTLEPKVDIFGDEVRTKVGNDVAAFVNTFFNPSNVGNIKTTRITREIDRLIKMNKNEKETSIIPTIVTDTIRYKGQDFELTPVQHTKYKKMYGKTLTASLNELLSSDEYNNDTTNADKFKLMSKTYNKAFNEAKKKTLKSFGYKVDKDE